ncbi:hypothetical protein HZC32_02235 [Candidatus Woesearchaeota archaeon]|nr:hypothetical protein [Candidatus Woesearchaeota archaeon]
MEAAQAKAEANAVLSSVGVGEENVKEFLDSKSKAVSKVISEDSAEGVFPILGYSYYKYAHSLMDQDKYLSLIYLEYALEMSDLEIYFPEENVAPEQKFSWEIGEEWSWLIIGVIIGILISGIVVLIRKSGEEKPEEEAKSRRKVVKAKRRK